MINGETRGAGAGNATERGSRKLERSKEQFVLALDADRLALVMAALAGTVVLAFCFWNDADGMTTAWRVGIAFIGAYAAMFFFVRIVLRSILRELVVSEQERKRKARQARNEANEARSRARAAASGGAPVAADVAEGERQS